MARAPTITEAQIRQQVGDRSLGLGRSYFRDQAILNPRRQGSTLKADCQGSAPQPYHVRASLGSHGISAAECSCPVGDGGHCKHVAALLLAWLQAPDSFTELQPLAVALQDRTREQLLVLIQQLIRLQPDLELLVQAPEPTAAAYRQHADALFRSAGDDWTGAHQLRLRLRLILDTAVEFLAQRDYPAAIAVYEGVSAATIDHLAEFADDDAELTPILASCIMGLQRCLTSDLPTPQRQDVLRNLFALYRADIEHGAFGYADQIPELFLQHATPAERSVLMTWLRQALPKASQWSREAYGSLLLDLGNHTLSPEEQLQISRDSGLRGEVIALLLDLDRAPEALTEAQAAPDYELPSLADQFVAHHREDLAERLIRQRANQAHDPRLLDWLIHRADMQKDFQTALHLALERFHQLPNFDSYRDLRARAKALNTWSALRPDLLRDLQTGQHFHTLLDIALEEKEFDRALALLESPRSASSLAVRRLQVAQAAERSLPQAALLLYQKGVERLLGSSDRNRATYRTAARLLQHIRTLYQRLNQSPTWDAYIAALRNKHHTLRALLDELQQARL